jgi:MFS family permease
MNSVAERALTEPASEPATAATAAAVAAQQRTTRRLLFVGIPLFWSSWYIYNAYLSVYAKSLGAATWLVGMIVAIYGFTQMVLRIPLGVLSDRLGRRKIFVLIGAVVGASGALPVLLAPSPTSLLIARGLAGIGAACWVPLTVLLVASYPEDQVARASVMASFLSGLGGMVPQYLGGLLAQATNVQVPFAVGIGLGIVAFVLLAQVREPARAAGKPTSIVALLRVGAVPMVLAVSLLALMNQYNVWATTQTFVPLYASKVLAANKEQLGLLAALWQGCNIGACFLSSAVHARLGTRWTVVLGTLGVAFTTLTVPAMPSLWALLALRLVHGAVLGIVTPVLMAGAISAVNVERRTAAMGFYAAIYAAGMVLGPAVSGALGDGLGFANTFYVVAALSLATAIAALFLPHRIQSAD